MAIAPSNTATTATAPGSGQNYGAPLATVTTLFFMWGFLTCLNDILVPHLKSIFDLNYAQAMLIQFAFFGAYFVFSIPSAKIIDWMGYQRSMVAGLLTMGLGAFLVLCQQQVFRPFRCSWAHSLCLLQELPAYRWQRILTLQSWESPRGHRVG